jgi:hypothetical protein
MADEPTQVCAAAFRKLCREGLFSFGTGQFYFHEFVVGQGSVKGSDDRVAHTGIADENDRLARVSELAQVAPLKSDEIFRCGGHGGANLALSHGPQGLAVQLRSSQSLLAWSDLPIPGRATQRSSPVGR